MTRTRDDALRWVDQGTELVHRALAGLGTDATLDAPSGLPDWTRKHLLAHVAANADGVANLTHWAATGEETPMYSSPEQRLADIEQGGSRPAAELLAWFDRSAQKLHDGFAGLDDESWQHEVVTAQGRTVPASETPWMRARELMVHATDFASGVTFDDLPADFLDALAADIVGKRAANNAIAVHIAPSDTASTWELPGAGEPVTVTGPLAQVVAWLAGRPHHDVTTADGGDAPDLGPWL